MKYISVTVIDICASKISMHSGSIRDPAVVGFNNAFAGVRERNSKKGKKDGGKLTNC
jgi:hypothetical protein